MEEKPSGIWVPDQEAREPVGPTHRQLAEYVRLTRERARLIAAQEARRAERAKRSPEAKARRAARRRVREARKASRR